MTPQKLMLASDVELRKLKYPCIVQPKIDGVRAAVHPTSPGAQCLGRSLKPFKNKAVVRLLSAPLLQGFDGEITIGNPTAQDCCRATTSVLSTIEGSTAGLTFHLFDYLPMDSAPVSYLARYNKLCDKVAEVIKSGCFDGIKIQAVPSRLVATEEELLAAEAEYLALGYEGLIIRSQHGVYKNGRSTVREGGLLRLKRFIDAEAECLRVVEGSVNENVAQVNELGRTFRTSHQENKVPNGLVGSLTCCMLADVIDPTNKSGEPVLYAGDLITVSPGEMDHATRRDYFLNQDKIVGKIVKFKFFPKGVKELPRFPTFISLRDIADL